jgi:hypothetical protein
VVLLGGLLHPVPGALGLVHSRPVLYKCSPQDHVSVQDLYSGMATTSCSKRCIWRARERFRAPSTCGQGRASGTWSLVYVALHSVSHLVQLQEGSGLGVEPLDVGLGQDRYLRSLDLVLQDLWRRPGVEMPRRSSIKLAGGGRCGGA